MGNIEFPYEVDHCVERGADGIGLYRTEFLYLSAEIEPTEETHFEAYSRVIKAMGDKPVVIRTLDLGADKLAQMPSPAEERNPVLGLRSIRMSLRNLPLFRTQLRAILRASALGNVRLMFPLITTLMELRQARMVLADVMEDLDENKIPFNRECAGRHDGRSAGGGDDDRSVCRRGRFRQHRHERPGAVFAGRRSQQQRRGRPVQHLRSGGAAADRHDGASRQAAEVPANLCGRMSSSTMYTQLLLGLGLRQFSVTPGAIPEVKRIIRATNIPQCEAIAAPGNDDGKRARHQSVFARRTEENRPGVGSEMRK